MTGKIRTASILVFAMVIITHAFSQAHPDPLFDARDPLPIAFSISIKEIRKSKEDSSYISHKLYYRNTSGGNDSIKVALKGRGNFRLRECYFPPLWLKIGKSKAKGTLFEGNKKLKLVLPCYNQRGNNDLILKEYLCYKLYQEISPYAFKTRLVNIDLVERRGKKDRTFQLKGILIEDIDKTAKRTRSRAVEVSRISPQILQDTGTMRFNLFQFMISNTDWSKAFQHNTKLINHHTDYIAVPYDFDMSGLVDAPYAVVSMLGDEPLPVESVRERYYRGYCKPPGVTQFVRNEFLAKEKKLLSLPDELKDELPASEISKIKDYLGEFFTILKNDRDFDNQILENCRNPN